LKSSAGVQLPVKPGGLALLIAPVANRENKLHQTTQPLRD